jgi:hypothetical protein
MPVVADATVFRYLVMVDATDILPALFGTVRGSHAIRAENHDFIGKKNQ